MKETGLRPLKHVFVCVNDKESDCCINVGGMALFLYLKQFVMENGLISKVWITKTKCLGFCNNIGATIAIYPQGKIFTEITKVDYEKIIKEINIDQNILNISKKP